MQLFSAGGAEAAGATDGVGELVGKLKVGSEERNDSKLCDALALLYRLGCIGMVMECDHNLAAIIGIDNANLVGRGESALGSQAAAREYKAAIALGYFHGNAGM